LKLLAGTSGFAFPEWKGFFYPKDLKSDGFLPYYASRFATVEINNTFYRLPKESVLEHWAEQVPEGFSFTIKASQRITHFARLKPESLETVEYLVRATAVMGDRLGPILFQLPPNMKREIERLRAFLAELPEGRRYAMEFRHASWFEDDAAIDALAEHQVALVVIDQEDYASPVRCTAPWSYIRLHRMDYRPADLARWSDTIKGLGRRETYVFFKHDHVPDSEGSGPLAADAFMKHWVAIRS
jgi:uncharacterized protein YecE (DUF72 family)